LASNGVLSLLQQNMEEGVFFDWGWRVPFLLSGVLIAVGLLIRVRILETPLFTQLKEANQISRAPVSEVLRYHYREVLLAAGSRICEQSCFYLFTVYVFSYAEKVIKIDRGIIFDGVNIAAAVEFFTIPLFGILSDHLSRKRAYVAGCLFLFVFAMPYFFILDTRNPALIIGAIVVSLAGGHAILYSVQASLIPELFGTRLRYSGASLGYQLASPFAGGLAPIIAVSLVQAFPNQYWPLAAYIMAISLVSLVCVQLLAETSKKDISG
ncbi:MAG TPA: MFS transporter, partial [Gemmataceae bacterium]|jgi:MFS family permease|nr:MFS transporter [Gemmataceae bacterium]